MAVKVITRTTDELVLRPPVGIMVWISVVFMAVLPIVSLLSNNRMSWWMTLAGILFWFVVVGALVFVPHGLVTKCRFSKLDNSLTVYRYAWHNWGPELHTLADILSVETYKQNEHFYTVSLQSGAGKIRLQGDLSREKAEAFAQEISSFLNVPRTVAI